MAHDPRRSPQALAYRQLYNCSSWRKLRRSYLDRHPLCVRCMMHGRVVVASVVNHITPHRGDEQLFNDVENLQSLCKPCHDGEMQSRERSGRTYDGAVGTDGMPIDPAHPFYAGEAK